MQKKAGHGIKEVGEKEFAAVHSSLVVGFGEQRIGGYSGDEGHREAGPGGRRESPEPQQRSDQQGQTVGPVEAFDNVGDKQAEGDEAAEAQQRQDQLGKKEGNFVEKGGVHGAVVESKRPCHRPRTVEGWRWPAWFRAILHPVTEKENSNSQSHFVGHSRVRLISFSGLGEKEVDIFAGQLVPCRNVSGALSAFFRIAKLKGNLVEIEDGPAAVTGDKFHKMPLGSAREGVEDG